MRVFLSYAHEPPENAAFVNRVRERLEAAHIETWIDTAQIKQGEDWRQSIVAGLRDCQQTIAFLSKKSVRDPGVCLDELAIALHEHGAIVPVPIEPPADIDAPHHVGGAQWIDMSGWQTQDDAWLDARVAELIAVLTSPEATTRAAEIATLNRALRPVIQSAIVAEKLDGFVGRDWAKTALDEKRARNPRLIWITGGPGSGKSAFAAWLATWHRSHTIALNLCELGNIARNDPGQIIRTIAFQLARRVPDYRENLLAFLGGLHSAPDHGPATVAANLPAIESRLAALPPDALFDALLAEPLGRCIDGGRGHDPYLLLLDGLDETIHDDDCQLAALLAHKAPSLPHWLAIAATSRDVDAIRARFAAFDPLELDSGGHISDLHAYALAWLRHLGQDSRVPAVVEAADGAFLYLTKLREAVEAGWLTLSAPDGRPLGLPRGLTGIYRRWFDHLFPDKAAYERDDLPLISVLTAARQPVPLPLLTEMFGWSPRQRRTILARLDRLFLVRDDALGPFHLSLRQWLADEDHHGAGPYLADEPDGIARLAATLWPRFAAWIADPATTPLDAFTQSELPAIALRQPEPAFRAALDTAGPLDRLHDTLIDQAQTHTNAHAWAGARDWLSFTLRATALRGPEALPLRQWAAVELGGVETTLGRTEAALAAFALSLTAAQGAVAAEPDNLDRQRDLSVSHSKIGDVKVAQGDLAGALASFGAGMEIARRLAEADPGNAGWQRDLAVSHHRLGSMKARMGDEAGAVESLRAVLGVLDGMAARGMHLDPAMAGLRQQLTAAFAGGGATGPAPDAAG